MPEDSPKLDIATLPVSSEERKASGKRIGRRAIEIVGGRGEELRKHQQVNLDTLEGLVQIHCSIPEIAAVFRISKSAMDKIIAKDKRVREIIENGKERGNVSLRRAQMKSALEGNVQMQMWLGAVRLGQTRRLRDGDLEEDREQIECVKYEWVDPIPEEVEVQKQIEAAVEVEALPVLTVDRLQ